MGSTEPVPPELIARMKQQAESFRSDLRSLLNRYSCENGSDTPDFILADYVIRCLADFDRATRERSKWEGRPGGMRSLPPQFVLTEKVQG